MHRKRSKRKRPRRSIDEGSYVCPSCGEQIEVPVDVSGGDSQQYVEDCPVCCRPNMVFVELLTPPDPPRVWAEPE